MRPDATILNVKNISKSYKLYLRNRDRLLEALSFSGKKRHTDFFALKGINFSLTRGESLGIIGSNGSGKSTLLKIISGVLAPTTGTTTVKGTMGCLLELGGGFNPELSGLENARLQLLLSGAERNTNELIHSIVEFADIGDFIQHPVKKYSSGMFMRLAFACATTISPSILIVDEALAVGDVFFVKKCMNRMRQLLDGGTTLLFVSHDLESVRRLCGKTLWLDGGNQAAFGSTKDVGEQYTAHIREREVLQSWAEKKNDATSPTADAPAILAAALHRVQGSIDLAEQRLFVEGEWLWHDEGPLRCRIASTPDAKAAFMVTGESLTLSFLRGNGFAPPRLFLDGKEHALSIDNNESYAKLTLAPAQIHNFTVSLPPGEHAVVLQARAMPAGWLGGGVSLAPTKVSFAENHEMMALWAKQAHVWGDGRAVVCNVELLGITDLAPVTHVHTGQYVRLRIHAKRLCAIDGEISLSYKVENHLSVCMFATSTKEEFHVLDASAALWVGEFVFCLPLKSGNYTISAAVVSKKDGVYTVHNNIDPAAAVTVEGESKRSVWGEFYNPTQVMTAQFYNK